jgi:hypothetical protein
MGRLLVHEAHLAHAPVALTPPRIKPVACATPSRPLLAPSPSAPCNATPSAGPGRQHPLWLPPPWRPLWLPPPRLPLRLPPPRCPYVFLLPAAGSVLPQAAAIALCRISR